MQKQVPKTVAPAGDLKHVQVNAHLQQWHILLVRREARHQGGPRLSP